MDSKAESGFAEAKSRRLSDNLSDNYVPHSWTPSPFIQGRTEQLVSNKSDILKNQVFILIFKTNDTFNNQDWMLLGHTFSLQTEKAQELNIYSVVAI